MTRMLKSAEAVLNDLLRDGRGPRDCPVMITENATATPNWTATAGEMPDVDAARFARKLGELRRIHPKLDWSAVNPWPGSKRRQIIKRLSELEPAAPAAG